jgi:hypothetical protein
MGRGGDGGIRLPGRLRDPPRIDYLGTAPLSDRIWAKPSVAVLASLGSAVVLLIFSAVTVAHCRTYRETGANLLVLIVALVATPLGTFAVFTTTTLVNEPRTAVALVIILVAAISHDLVWKGVRDRTPPSAVG